jgi:hypothetical protein
MGGERERENEQSFLVCLCYSSLMKDNKGMFSQKHFQIFNQSCLNSFGIAANDGERHRG